MQALLRPNLPKPRAGEACNGCGYCCTMEPCMLAQEMLRCVSGPCIALEVRDGRGICGLVRNPLGYLFQAAHPGEDIPVLEAAPDIAEGHELSNQIAQALGVGKGCDSDDDQGSAAWPGPKC